MSSRSYSAREHAKRLAEVAADDAYYRDLDARPAPGPYVSPLGDLTGEPDPDEDDPWLDRELEKTFSSWPAPYADRSHAVRAVMDRVRGRTR